MRRARIPSVFDGGTVVRMSFWIRSDSAALIVNGSGLQEFGDDGRMPSQFNN